MKFLQAIFIVFVLGIVVSLSGPGCASIVPPLGGPRDSLPPLLMSVNPPDSSLQFAGKRIVFQFDEFVQLQDIQQNLLVTPVPKINPTTEVKLRTVTLQLKDTLEENTTYTINFGNALRDINEGNIFRDFTYVFSTGNYIDSLEVSGRVMLAQTGAADSTLIVLLHSNMEDSAVITDRPRYVTYVNRDGNFTFSNLPAGVFKIYALKDEGGSRRYLSKAQLFAFSDSVIDTRGSPDPVSLFAYVEKEETRPPTSTARPATTRDAPNPQTDKRLRFETNAANAQLDLLSNFQINFRLAPLRSFDSTKVQLLTETFQPLTNYRFVRDTSNTKVTLTHPWTENTVYKVILDKDFAEDTMGRKLLKTDTLTFRTKRENEYGLVRLRLLNLDLSKNPVLQFVQNNDVKFSHVFTNNEFYSRLFVPGEYELRILFDENRNGIWDAGEFFKEHRQPELVMPISRKLTVKANWDNEVDIQL